MSADVRERHFAEYQFPGSFFPESTSRELPAPTFEAALSAAPDEDGYFRKGGWYAVRIHTRVEKRFTASDGAEEWVKQGEARTVGHWVIGDRIHFSDIEPTRENSILISNIECNSRDGGYGVLTRCGNWQIASDYTAVVAPSEVSV